MVTETLKGKIPLQIDENSNEIKASKSLALGIKVATAIVFSSSVVLKILFGSGMFLMWSMVNTIQIISLLPLMHLEMPAFLIFFFS